MIVGPCGRLVANSLPGPRDIAMVDGRMRFAKSDARHQVLKSLPVGCGSAALPK
jgi:hypothetical protein